MADLDKKLRELDAAASIADDDSFLQYDKSEVTDKRSSWSLIKSTLKTYLDAFYSTTANIADSTNKRFVTDAQQTVLGNTSGTNSGDETTTTAGALVNGATAKTTPVDADTVGFSDSAASNVLKKVTWANVKATLKNYFDGLYAPISSVSVLANASISNQSGFSSDQYLDGSAITIGTAGGWSPGSQYRVRFDMSKTAAGTKGTVITIRVGTTGTVSDASVGTLSFTAGTAVSDFAIFDVMVVFRSVGSGTSARVQGIGICMHQKLSDGFAASSPGDNEATFSSPSGFDSSAATKIGVSFNGGDSFSGACKVVQAQLMGI